jgi:hypothetical protein
MPNSRGSAESSDPRFSNYSTRSGPLGSRREIPRGDIPRELGIEFPDPVSTSERDAIKHNRLEDAQNQEHSRTQRLRNSALQLLILSMYSAWGTVAFLCILWIYGTVAPSAVPIEYHIPKSGIDKIELCLTHLATFLTGAAGASITTRIKKAFDE